MKEKLERVIKLKEELARLLEIAVSQGASEEEINRLLDDYNFANDLIALIQRKMKEGQ